MSSNFACVGLHIDDEQELEALLRSIEPKLVSVGRFGNVDVRRWDDPSGARLVLRVRKGVLVGFVPSFAGSAGAFLANGSKIAEEVWRVDVVDAAGEPETVATVDLEEDGLVEIGATPTPATIVALGNEMKVYRNEAAFASSDDSLLDPSGTQSEAPPLFAENGWPWPPRMGPESFMSHGTFGPVEEATTTARLNGTVIRSARHVNEQTGLAFGVARIRTLGMEIDLCLAGDEHPDPPNPGQVVGGVAYLVASVGTAARKRDSFMNRLGFRFS